MQLADVNVLLYALEESSRQHPTAKEWLESLLRSGQPFAVSEIVLAGVVRIATNRRLYESPYSLDSAFGFVEVVRAARGARTVAPGSRHWSLFSDLCREHDIAGPDMTDAYIAAIAIEHDCEFVTFDKGFGRFRELRLLTLT